MPETTKIYRIDLSDEPPMERHPHKPELGVYVEAEDGEASVVLQIGGLWGQHMRWVQMTADQADKLADLLQIHARTIKQDDLAELIDSPVREDVDEPA